ncbi:MAG TPA: diguanylate cyclase [Ardenticatenaceae bacterium]|jgi:diguanylate cyclase (GGDEF)-like protein/putative nucleotidyltransferase with HDIG domain
MSRRAWIYIWSILITGLVLAVVSFVSQPMPLGEWPALVVLVTFATLAQLLKAETPNHQLYYATMVFLFAALILLNPFFFVLVAAIPHLVEWVKERMTRSRHLRDWYLQPFNIATHIITGLCAHWLYVALNSGEPGISLTSVAAGIAAAFLYVFLNHAIIGQALILARGATWRGSGVLSMDGILNDMVQLCLGYIVAVLWTVHPVLVLPGLTPLILIYRALTIPQLQQEARTDTKTGLWNARYFSELFNLELERAARFQRPLSILVADLDLLRNINNTYGHLAGDVVLEGVGRTIAETIREYDFAGRFGGEEFIIALPETQPEEAYFVAERVRKAVEAAQFYVKTSNVPIHATMSVGIASFPEHAVTANDLIHEADVAVYQAKLQGRNRSVGAMHEERSGWEEPERIDRLASPFIGTFVSRPDSLTGLSLDEPEALEETAAALTAETTSAPVVEEPQSLAVSLKLEPAEVSPPDEPLSNAEPQSVRIVAQTPPAPVEPQPQAEAPAEAPRARFMTLRLYVTMVIAAGILSTLGGLVWGGEMNWHVILLFTILAMTAELLQMDLYGDGTISISVALNFAAALVAGIPGAAAVSAAIALVHWMRRRPPLYKSGFNWATHALAGVTPGIVMQVVGLPVTIANLPIVAIPAMLSAVALYVVDSSLITGAIALQERAPLLTTWHKHFRWLAQHYLVLCVMGLFLSAAYVTLGLLGMLVFAMPLLMMRYSQRQYVDRTKESIAELERVNNELSQANEEINAANQAIRQLNDELFMTVAHILDARDPFVSGHAAKVADYATAIAVELGLPEDQVMLARQGGLLHDIGKIGIKESVLYKPSRLTDEEFEHIKSHATVGAELLETSRSLRHLSPFVRHHHERWDGKGYPAGLAEDQTPLIARILACADAVEAMASDRPYHRGMPLSEIVAEVKRCAGSHFDPEVAQAFVSIIERDAHLVINSAREVAERQGSLNVKGSTYNTGSGWYVQFPGTAPSTVA